MATRLETSGPASGVTMTDTAPRVTPAPARPFKQVMSAGAQAMIAGADAAIRRLPGGPILAAALRPGAAGISGGYGGGGLPLGGPGIGGPGTGETARPEGAQGTATDGTAGAGGSVENMMNQNADMNLYYLELQERISAESRAYSTVSNVLKARHETVKNAIGNIR